MTDPTPTTQDNPMPTDNPPTQSVTPWYLDKAFYLTALGLILPFVASKVGFAIDPNKIADAIIWLVGLYVALHKAKSAAVLIAEIQARAKAIIGLNAPVDSVTAAKALNKLLTDAKTAGLVK